MNRKRYKNRLAISTLAKWVVSGIILAAIGCSFVFIRSQHLAKERQKETLRAEIKDIRLQIKSTNNHITSVMQMPVLRSRLLASRSVLTEIEPSEVELIGSTSKDSQMAYRSGK